MAKYLAEGMYALETMKTDRGLSEFMETTDDGMVVCNGHISDAVAEAVAIETEKVWEAFMDRLAELGWPKHLVALANDRTMEDVALLHLGLTREVGHNPDAELRMSDAVMETREAHDASGMPEREPVDKKKDQFRAPGLLGFIKGLAAGFTTDNMEVVSPGDFGGVKPWMKYVKDSTGFGKFYANRPKVNFGWKVMVSNGKTYYRGVYYSSNGPIWVFARCEDYVVSALIGNILVKFHYGKGGSMTMDSIDKVEDKVLDKLWSASGIDRGLIGHQAFPSKDDLVHQLHLAGLAI